MAFQGKLVEQREDKKVSVAEVDEIRKTQAKLAKDKLIKIGKYDKENYEYDYDYPESWTLAKIGDISNLVTKQTGFDYSKTIKPSLLDHYEENTLPLIQTRNFKGKEFNMVSAFYIPIAVANEYEQLKLKEKCLLVSIVGSIGNVGLFDEDAVGFLGGAITKIDLTEKDLTDYIFYFLQSPIGQYQLNKNKKKTAQATITVEDVRNIIIPIPPLEERHRIVAKIDELLPYVDRYAEAYEKLEQFNAKFPEDMKKSILQYAIQGKLVEQRPEEGTAEELYKQIQENQPTLKDSKSDLVFESMDFDIPETWKWVEVNQIFDFVDYRGKTPNKIAEGVFLVTASNIRQGYMDYTRKEHISRDEYETRKSRGITEKGDLLFTTEAPMGNAAICDLEECSCGQRVITFKEYTDGTVCSKLFMYFILSPAFQKQLVDNCTGTTAKGIKADKLKHLLLPLPPIGEQYRIVEKIDELLPFCNRLSERG